MIFTDEKDTSLIYDMDLTTQQVVETYKASEQKKHEKMRHLLNSQKNG